VFELSSPPASPTNLSKCLPCVSVPLNVIVQSPGPFFVTVTSFAAAPRIGRFDSAVVRSVSGGVSLPVVAPPVSSNEVPVVPVSN